MRHIKEPRAWGAQERLRYIDRAVFWKGTLRRADLMKKFGISVQMASADIQTYCAQNPRALKYDTRRKLYVAVDGMRPLHAQTEIKDALELLDERAEDAGPWMDKVKLPGRDFSLKAVQAIFRAVAHGRSIRIKYASLNSSTFRWRWITPHAFGYDGFRWHVRAFCHTDRTFKDFVLGRVAEADETGAPEATAASDTEWVQVTQLKLATAAGLPAESIKALNLDFGLKDMTLTITTRAALIPYVLAQMGLSQNGKPVPSRFRLV